MGFDSSDDIIPRFDSFCRGIPIILGILHSDYCRELQVILSQYYKEVFGCKGATGFATPRPHWHSNFVGTSSLLRLHHTVAMAAEITFAIRTTNSWEGVGVGGSAGNLINFVLILFCVYNVYIYFSERSNSMIEVIPVLIAPLNTEEDEDQRTRIRIGIIAAYFHI